MRSKHGWLIVLVIVALLVVACGPQQDAPTLGDQATAQESDVTAVVETPIVATEEKPTEEPTASSASSAELPVDEGDWHVLGSPDAPVTIVEYSDFQWPFCAQYVRETFPQILDSYIDGGQVRYVFRNFPLFSIHPQAAKAGEAAECAGEQGAFWEMHDALFDDQGQWSGSPDAETTFKEMAGDLGLDQAQFDACLDEGKYANKVIADYQEGTALGISSTPAFRVNGAALSGAQEFSVFQQQIDYFLAGGEAPSLEVDAGSFRSMGQADAPVVVTEFSDYQWPACESIAREVIPDLIAQYVDTGKVRFVYREFPLTSIHPVAPAASAAAVCAGKQDKYWEMNEHLFANQGEWSQAADPDTQFSAYAEELDLDTETFDECLASGEGAVVVQGDLLTGESLGVDATPYFFINDLPVRGGLPIEALGRVIDYAAAGGPPPEIVPSGPDWHVRGDPQTARAITVAFVDYASPESAEHATEVLPQLVEEYVDSGQLVYILQPWSEGADSASTLATIATECAGQQGQGWEMHDQVFAEQGSWTTADEPASLFAAYAEALNLNAGEFEACLDSEWATLRAQTGSVVGTLYGVPGAPTFLFNNGQGQQGSPSLDEFKAVIESILGP